MGLAEKLETNHDGITNMMQLRVADGLSAMAYGQYGGSFPDPTPRTVFDVDGDIYDADGEPVPVRWRDARPEQDLVDYVAGIVAAEKALDYVDFLRRKYTSANEDIRNRLDPSDFCRVHWFCQFDRDLPDKQKFCPKRVVGDLCKDCNQFRVANGREPTATEADFYHRHGRWPHKLVDPKERRAV